MDARFWDERYAAEGMVWSEGPNQFVESECAGLAPGRAVDLAAGEGRNARWLAAQGWEVTAVDFSRVGLDKGRRLAAADQLDVTWVCADVTEWKPTAPVDLAVIAYLQVVTAVRTSAVRHAFDGLTEGGHLVVVAHDATNLVEGVGGPQDPTVLYSANDVLADLGDRTFDVVIAERVTRPVHSPERPDAVAYDALVHLIRRDTI